jgi:hypothetical protein
MSALDKAEGGAVLLVVALVAFVAWRVVKAAPEVAKAAGGLVTGDNAVTQSATNAQGEHVSAYEGQGIAGTLGAAANAASGGHLASWGEDLGSWFYDLTHEDEPNKPAFTGGASGSW